MHWANRVLQSGDAGERIITLHCRSGPIAAAAASRRSRLVSGLPHSPPPQISSVSHGPCPPCSRRGWWICRSSMGTPFVQPLGKKLPLAVCEKPPTLSGPLAGSEKLSTLSSLWPDPLLAVSKKLPRPPLGLSPLLVCTMQAHFAVSSMRDRPPFSLSSASSSNQTA